MNAKVLVQPSIADDVSAGLLACPKTLPPKLLYDDRGSALFEQITRLPEYYLTSTERAIFSDYAPQMIECAGDKLSIIELGAGSASKTVLLLNAAVRQQRRADFYPVDVSPSALTLAETRLRRFANVNVTPIVADYTRGLGFLRTIRGRKLILYIGSSIGNFEPMASTAILAALHSAMSPGDAILLGTDMRKSTDILIPAYDDPQGVTAAFNLNVLARINRELHADFDLDTFAHRVVWNSDESRIEMHLQSKIAQRVHIRDLGVDIAFQKDETIHTENSYKYSMPMIRAIVENARLELERTWTDERGWFTVHLLRRS